MSNIAQIPKWKADLITLLYDEVYQAYYTLSKYKSVHESLPFSAIKDVFNKEIIRIAEELSVIRCAVVGEYSSGKSCFINSLLGQDIAPAELKPLTHVLTFFKHGDGLEITTDDGRAYSLSRYQSDVQATGRNVPNFHIKLDSDILAYCDLIDSPGWDSPSASLPNTDSSALTSNEGENLSQKDTRLSEDAFKGAEIVLVLFDITEGEIKETSRDKLKKMIDREGDAKIQRIFIIANKADQMFHMKRETVLDACRKQINELSNGAKCLHLDSEYIYSYASKISADKVDNQRLREQVDEMNDKFVTVLHDCCEKYRKQKQNKSVVYSKDFIDYIGTLHKKFSNHLNFKEKQLDTLKCVSRDDSLFDKLHKLILKKIKESIRLEFDYNQIVRQEDRGSEWFVGDCYVTMKRDTAYWAAQRSANRLMYNFTSWKKEVEKMLGEKKIRCKSLQIKHLIDISKLGEHIFQELLIKYFPNQSNFTSEEYWTHEGSRKEANRIACEIRAKVHNVTDFNRSITNGLNNFYNTLNAAYYVKTVVPDGDCVETHLNALKQFITTHSMEKNS